MESLQLLLCFVNIIILFCQIVNKLKLDMFYDLLLNAYREAV